jgi:hypothetical protein
MHTFAYDIVLEILSETGDDAVEGFGAFAARQFEIPQGLVRLFVLVLDLKPTPDYRASKITGIPLGAVRSNTRAEKMTHHVEE